MAATNHGAGIAGLGRGATALAVVTVQAVAFSAAYAAGVPTLYAGFVVASAVALALLAGEGAFGAAMAALAGVMLVALGVPLLLFVVRQDPALVAAAATDPAVLAALWLGVYAPLLAAVASVVFGVPLALLLTREFAGRPAVESLVDLPLVVPHAVAGLVVLYGFGEGGMFPGLGVLGTLSGMVLAMTFVSAPFAVNAAREAFEAVDPRLARAARSQGASPWETFRRVTAPLAARGVLTGGVLAWARAVSEFGAVAIVAYNVEVLVPFPVLGRLPELLGFEPVGTETTAQHAPVFVYRTFLADGLAASGAVALLLLAVSAVVFVAVRWLAADGTRGGFP